MSPLLSVGVDEAGRGCVLGPLVVAIVAATEADRRWFARWNVRDSKIVPADERNGLAERIKERCWFGIRIAHPPQIDAAVRDRSLTLNGLERELMADLLREFRRIHPTNDARMLVDAPSINANGFRDQLRAACGWTEQEQLRAAHHADATDRTVGAASLIAKAERERHITMLKQELGTDFGCGYSHDALTIAHVKTAPEGAVHVRWSWATAQHRHDAGR